MSENFDSNALMRHPAQGGGCSRTRTCDPLIKSQLLYQLSYAPVAGARSIARRLRLVDRPAESMGMGLPSALGVTSANAGVYFGHVPACAGMKRSIAMASAVACELFVEYFSSI